jgi:hypothetical protein
MFSGAVAACSQDSLSNASLMSTCPYTCPCLSTLGTSLPPTRLLHPCSSTPLDGPSASARSIGLCTVQYLYGTEIYPTRIRSVSYDTNMSLHWFFQFAIVRVTPNMFVSLNIWGSYVFWAMACAVGFVLLGLWAPETKGIAMERMEELFAGTGGWDGMRGSIWPSGRERRGSCKKQRRILP